MGSLCVPFVALPLPNRGMEALSFQSFIFFFTRANKVYVDVEAFSTSQVPWRGRGRI